MKRLSLVIAAATLAGLAVPATAYAAHRGRVIHHGVRHSVVVVRRRRVGQVIAPARYVPLGPDEFVDPYNPGYRRGVDDGSRYDTTADGIAAGADEPVPGPRNLGIRPVSSYPAPGYEIEGPPVSPALPVIPEAVDPTLY